MKYKILDGCNRFSDVLSSVLYNRGISDIDTYKNLSEKNTHNYSLLQDIDKAVECLCCHINKKSNIAILVDCDVDGYTSGAIIYQYLEKNTKCELRYLLHDGKEHGLSEDIYIPKGTNLLIIPDAGTNDVEQCKKLKSQGIDIIVLDHHEKEVENPYAIIVNNQIGDYPNKSLCGAGVTYKFIQAIDEELWTESADNYIDLVALGLISDCMDIRSFENRYLINKGLENINNLFFRTLFLSQEYSTHGEINIENIEFYITPLLNALIRIGTESEKEMLFEAFIQHFQKFDYYKAKLGVTEEENIYNRVCRLCKNAHGKQNRMKEKYFEIISQEIVDKEINKNPIIILNVSEKCDKRISGLVANKIADSFKKPCVLLREQSEDILSGSARNMKNSFVPNFKKYLNDTNICEKVRGHQSAFGVFIQKDSVKELNEVIKKDFGSFNLDNNYCIDFSFDKGVDISFAKEIADLKEWWGYFVESPYILIKDIKLNLKDIQILGKENNTWKYTFKNDNFSIIKFKCKSNDKILNLIKTKELQQITFSVIGKIDKNFFNNKISLQLIVEDYEINERNE